ncbi:MULTISPECIES: haloacid dehalogenase type II [Rhodomicrobium]|uniref:haloacid dehalogenase type II n=1 Tax=Rhodomicrobium TaxID=1068 RepID=UPI000B4AE165|nr:MULTISPECIES: haloacid dehalogenase type II [Rhodomicrobium]
MTMTGPRPEWLTFDCYGTLIQWDEGLLAAVDRILARSGLAIDPHRFIEIYDRHEHRLEQQRPELCFKDVAAKALRLAMAELSLVSGDRDADILTSAIGKMPPFPEVVDSLGRLKAAGFKLAIISNTDDAIIAGNVAQLGGHVDKVVTAQHARAYKPSAEIFRYAWTTLGIEKHQLVHICASPHLDLVAARALGFRAIWIDRGTGRKPLGDYELEAVASRLDQVPQILADAGWM